MTFRKTYFKIFILASGFALFGCNSSNNNGGGSGTIQAQIIVLSITRNPNTITTLSKYYTCDTTQAVLESDTSTESFAVANGKLITWDDSDCTAEEYSGSSSDIIGTWTTTGLDQEVAIPDLYRPTNCPATLPTDSSDIGDPLSNFSATATVTSSMITESVSGQICFGSLLAQEFADTSLGMTVTDSGCGYVVVKNSASGQSIRYDESFSGNVLTTKITSGSTSCSLDESIDLPGSSMPNCPMIWSNEQAFYSCVAPLEGGTAFAKPAVMSIHHRRIHLF